MRYDLIQEGVRDEHTGILFLPGSLKWVTEKHVPVSYSYNWDRVIGKANDLQREDNGMITAEIVWDERYQKEIDDLLKKDPKGWSIAELGCGIRDLSDSLRDSKLGERDLKSGTIREIAIISSPPGIPLEMAKHVWNHERDIPYYGD